MDDTVQAARDAFQRFQALVLQFRENHTAWQEAVRMGNLPRQVALIAREGDILTAVCEAMTAFQAAIAERLFRHRETYSERNAMPRYDIFQERELKAHLTIPKEGAPTWDHSPDALGGQWMDDALREGLVATITDAPDEEAWYYGGLTMRPHRPEREE